MGRAALHQHVQREANRNGELALQVSGLTDAYLKYVTFRAYAGEVLEFAGLAGAGRTETAKAIFGARRPIEGEIRVDGKLVRIRRPDAMRAGTAICYRRPAAADLSHGCPDRAQLRALSQSVSHIRECFSGSSRIGI